MTEQRAHLIRSVKCGKISIWQLSAFVILGRLLFFSLSLWLCLRVGWGEAASYLANFGAPGPSQMAPIAKIGTIHNFSCSWIPSLRTRNAVYDFQKCFSTAGFWEWNKDLIGGEISTRKSSKRDFVCRAFYLAGTQRVIFMVVYVLNGAESVGIPPWNECKCAWSMPRVRCADVFIVFLVSIFIALMHNKTGARCENLYRAPSAELTFTRRKETFCSAWNIKIGQFVLLELFAQRELLKGSTNKLTQAMDWNVLLKKSPYLKKKKNNYMFRKTWKIQLYYF